MKKIGIITFHTSYNYGAFLQAKATEESIKKIGAEPVFIDYTNSEEKKQRRLFKYTDGLSIKENFKNFLAAVYIGIFRKEFSNGRANFENSIKQLPKTKKIKRKSEIEEEFQILLSGSDQIWNPQIFNGKIDSIYFGDVGFDVRKIAYASSMGSYSPDNVTLQTIAGFLSEYEAIGVREMHAKNILEPVIDVPIQEVLDPTLLLSGIEWSDFFPDKSKYDWLKPDSYILLYFVAEYKDKKEYIEFLRKIYKGKKIIWVKLDNRNNLGVDYVITNATPYDFIELIMNAHLIVTDSFHGTVFSINFQKQFVSTVNISNPERVKNILFKLGLERRIVNNIEELNVVKEHINYEKPIKVLNQMRKESISWLKQAVDGEQL